MENTNKDKLIFYAVVRLALYFAVCVALMYFIEMLAKCKGTCIFDENGFLENMQFLMLVLTGIVYLAHAFLCKSHSTAFALCSSLAFMGACRELDNVFDKALPVISWRIGVVFIVAAAIYTVKNAKDFRKAFLDLATTPAFFLAFNAMIVIGPVAQLIGHKGLIQAALPMYTSVGDIKELFEECAECVGYLLLLLSSIEAFFCTRKCSFRP